jgi:hypothetical protein
MNTRFYSDWTCGTDAGLSDARVSKVALEAANQIDELIKGRNFDIAPVLELAELIKTSFAIDSETEGKKFVDSGAVALFLQATDEHPKNIGELVSRAMNIATDLKNTAIEGTNLQQLRDFCLAISSAARSFCKVPVEPEEALM